VIFGWSSSRNVTPKNTVYGGCAAGEGAVGGALQNWIENIVLSKAATADKLKGNWLFSFQCESMREPAIQT
jgi:hypothetical protein